MKPTVTISPRIEQSAALRPVVEQATEWLLGIVRDSPEPITAKWCLTERMSTGEQWIELLLTGTDAEKMSFNGLFTPDELRNQSFTEPALRELYLALLKFRTNELVNRHPEALAGAG